MHFSTIEKSGLAWLRFRRVKPNIVSHQTHRSEDTAIGFGGLCLSDVHAYKNIHFRQEGLLKNSFEDQQDSKNFSTGFLCIYLFLLCASVDLSIMLIKRTTRPILLKHIQNLFIYSSRCCIGC